MDNPDDLVTELAALLRRFVDGIEDADLPMFVDTHYSTAELALLDETRAALARAGSLAEQEPEPEPDPIPDPIFESLLPGFREEALQDEFRREFSLLQDLEDFWLSLSPVDGWCVLSYLQLACRHPDSHGYTRDRVKHVAECIEYQVARAPALREVARRGWSPDYDGRFVTVGYARNHTTETH